MLPRWSLLDYRETDFLSRSRTVFALKRTSIVNSILQNEVLDSENSKFILESNVSIAKDLKISYSLLYSYILLVIISSSGDQIQVHCSCSASDWQRLCSVHRRTPFSKKHRCHSWWQPQSPAAEPGGGVSNESTVSHIRSNLLTSWCQVTMVHSLRLSKCVLILG